MLRSSLKGSLRLGWWGFARGLSHLESGAKHATEKRQKLGV